VPLTLLHYQQLLYLRGSLSGMVYDWNYNACDSRKGHKKSPIPLRSSLSYFASDSFIESIDLSGVKRYVHTRVSLVSNYKLLHRSLIMSCVSLGSIRQKVDHRSGHEYSDTDCSHYKYVLSFPSPYISIMG